MGRHRQHRYEGRHRASSASLHRVIGVGVALVVIATGGALAAANNRRDDPPAEQPIELVVSPPAEPPAAPTVAPAPPPQDLSSEGSGLVPSEENKESDPEIPRPLDPTPPSPDCVIANLGTDVAPPVRDVACFLRDEFPEITMVLGTSPQPKGSDHQRGLAIDVFASPEVIDRIKKSAARHFDDWHLRNIIHGDQIMVTREEGFRPLRANEGPGMDEYVHLALRDASPIPASSLVP